MAEGDLPYIPQVVWNISYFIDSISLPVLLILDTYVVTRFRRFKLDKCASIIMLSTIIAAGARFLQETAIYKNDESSFG
jgi:hypothetical protein